MYTSLRACLAFFITTTLCLGVFGQASGYEDWERAEDTLQDKNEGRCQRLRDSIQKYEDSIESSRGIMDDIEEDPNLTETEKEKALHSRSQDLKLDQESLSQFQEELKLMNCP